MIIQQVDLKSTFIFKDFYKKKHFHQILYLTLTNRKGGGHLPLPSSFFNVIFL